MENSARIASLLLLSSLLVGDTRAQGTAAAGDACQLGDRQGVCRLFSHCPEMRDALLGGEPIVCSYDGLVPVVCCPSARMASRMCKKYSEAVYRYVKNPEDPSQTVKKDQCALRLRSKRIAGGEKARPNEFPHMALLGYGDVHKPQWSCGGSLISNRYVLTVASCIRTTLGQPVVVRLGELNLMTTEEINVHKDIRVSKSILHPDNKEGVLYHDVGLLQLSQDVEFTASIRPACLYSAMEIPDTELIATGWGFIDWEVPEMNDHLMKAKLLVQETEVCQKAYRPLATTSRLRNGIIEESMICAGAGRNDTCRGDSGGPLQMTMKIPYCMYSIVGLTSFGKGNCGTSRSPAVYTRVSHYLPWIDRVVWANEK